MVNIDRTREIEGVPEELQVSVESRGVGLGCSVVGSMSDGARAGIG